ncbi:hypothetical protein EYV94_15470 [Puteibacter caeruleilacunae]|nr:hypothetical protein EYV94_15470 [Puteibacter caeruleilacunae]
MRKVILSIVLLLPFLMGKAIETKNLKYIGMPVSGVCTGQVYLGGDGQLWYWDIFNVGMVDPGGPGDRFYLNPLTQEKKFPNGFGLKIIEGDRVHHRALNERGFSDISFEGEYPVGKVYYKDPTLPVDASLVAYSPFIPTDADNSGLPVTVLEYTVTNNQEKEVTVEITGWLQNMAGYFRGKGKDVQNTNSIVKGDDYVRLVCSTDESLKEELADWGNMSLTLIGEGKGAATAGKPRGINVYMGDPKNKEAKAKMADPLVGTVSGSVKLKKGESKTFTYLLSWYFPNVHLWDMAHHWKGLKNIRHYYSAQFKNAAEVGDYVLQNKWLLSATKDWNKTWYNSTLPKWFLDRTFLNVSTLATTVSIRMNDITDNPENEGRFYTMEGVNLGHGTCTHVFHYEQAMGRVFPHLTSQLREQVDYGLSFKEEGIIGYRGEMSGFGQHDGRGYAVDGHAGTILRTYREHTMSADNAFLKRNWSKIKKSMQYMIAQDKEKTGKADGILEGIQYNTLDRMWYGKITWISGLYAAALKASEQMALDMNDSRFAKECKKISAMAFENISEELFNGEYFIQKLDPEHPEAPNTNDGCHTDQLLGQYWAAQMGLGHILPQDEVITALKSMMKYNYVDNYQAYLDTASIPIKRWYADDDERGIIMCTFPKGGTDKAPGIIKNDWEKLVVGYFSEMWTGQEHQLAATLISEGLTDEAMKVEKAVHDRYSAERRNPYNEIEYGNHYTRAMSGYAPFVAAGGYVYHGPKGIIEFDPKFTPKSFQSAFIAAEGWGSYTQELKGNKQSFEIELTYGELSLNQVNVTLIKVGKPSNVVAMLNGQAVDVKFKVEGKKLTVKLPKTNLKKTDKLSISVQ